MTKKYNVLLEKELEKKGGPRRGLIGALRRDRCDHRHPPGFQELKRRQRMPDDGEYLNIKFRSPGFEEDAKKLCFTERQASAILEMRLYKLIGLEILALQKAYKGNLKKDPGIPPYPVQPEKTWMRSSRKIWRSDPGGVLYGAEEMPIEDREEIVFRRKKEAAREMIFAMGQVRLLQASGKRPFMGRNPETVQAEHVETVPVMTDDRICFFTDTGSMYQVKAADVPGEKLKDKGVPLDNISRFEGAKERILLTMPRQSFLERSFCLPQGAAMLKIVPGGEFPHGQPHGGRHKASEGDQAAEIRIAFRETEIVLQTKEGHVPPVHDKRDPGA